MNIQPGTSLGRYEIRSLIGEGGMGQVYRATDTSLGRNVAIKILPPDVAAGRERMYRFEQEAKAAGALNHPNIVAIYDVGAHNGAPYVVSELLEGETLRERLQNHTLPLRKSLEFAIQIARGLAAAHAKGIVHRDIKPENLFITSDGHVKILDFGIAKLISPLRESGTDTEADTVKLNTHPGVVMGTAGYMAPEQVRGRPADHRADIFAFGAVFYEMLSGRRPFQGDTSIETMSAILTSEPPVLSELNHYVPPAVERVVNHCLEKKPEERFQSTRDLAFDLEALAMSTTVSTTTGRQRAITKLHLPSWFWPAIGGILGLAALVGAFFIGRGSGQPELPTYTQLTFRRGALWSARFSSDANTIVYSASWNGNPVDIFSTRAESTESRSLDLKEAELLAVSSSNELAILLNRSYVGHFISRGTLARIPLGGGTPREVADNVQQADWSPDGMNLAIVRYVDGKNRLEYPVGKILYETNGYIAYPRVSPKGDMIAFMDHPEQWDDRGFVAVVDLNGKKERLSGEWVQQEGLAWTPDEKEIWFTASKAGEAYGLHAVSTSGRERTITRVPTNLFIHDISRDGTVLITGYKFSTPIIGAPPGDREEKDLSWLDEVGVFDLSADGTEFIFQYYGQGSGKNYSSYLRKTDGSPAKRLGDGAAIALSPDGKWVISVLNVPRQTVLLPTGAGEARQLPRNGIEDNGDDNWMPDGKRILFTGRESGKPVRTYVQDIEGSKPFAITPEGIAGTRISPDGNLLFASESSGKRVLYPLSGGPTREVHGLTEGDRVINWTADSRSLFVYTRGEFPVKVYRLDLSTGRRELIREIRPADAAGVLNTPIVFMTPDGRSYLYQLQRYICELYLVNGLFQKRGMF
jgi:serine/threonine protein kinase